MTIPNVSGPSGPSQKLAVGTILGPAAFISAWAIGGAGTPGYSAVSDAISRLAAVGAETKTLMDSGLLTYAIAVPIAAFGLRKTIGTASAVALGLNGLLTFGVLAAPLDRSDSVDQVHAVFAGSAYLALTAAILLSAGKLKPRWLRRATLVAGAITAVALGATALTEWSGFFQRLGLTTGDAWMITLSVMVLAGHDPRQER